MADSRRYPTVLFVAGAGAPDYQCDMVHHGLKTVLGSRVEETRHAWYMYDDQNPERIHHLYGRGFTMYGRVPSATRAIVSMGPTADLLTSAMLVNNRLHRRTRQYFIQRPKLASGVVRKLERRAYDLVIFGSILRCDDLLATVLASYPPERIGFVDGEDDPGLRLELVGKGVYFKRELLSPQSQVLPLNFAVPSELVLDKVPPKLRDWATVRPGEPETYVFIDEGAYFNDYRSSRYALTIRKAGWDCLRHYEILMNGCVPYFPGLEDCPMSTMTAFPKDLVLAATDRLDTGTHSTAEYHKLALELLSHTRAKLTTRALAAYVLGELDARVDSS